jgi:hypothetical protein
MLRDTVGERKGGKIDKHENAYPFLEKCFATVLGNPTTLPVPTSLSNASRHYTFQAIGPVNADGTIDVPKFPAWAEYAIRGEKRSTEVDDVQQNGTFAGKVSKDKGTVFGFDGTVRIYDFHPYVKKTKRIGEAEFQVLAVDDEDKRPAFRATCTAVVVPEGCCHAPQVQNWEIGYLQNVTQMSITAHYAPRPNDKDSYAFDAEVQPGTKFTIPDHSDSHIPFPGAKRDHSTDFYGGSHTVIGNCGHQAPHRVQDSPDSAFAVARIRQFPSPGPPPVIQGGLLCVYFLEKQGLEYDFAGWCAARHANGGFFVPLQQVTFQLRVDALSLDAGKECKAELVKGPGAPTDAPITDGGSMKEYLDATPPKSVDGPANTVLTKPNLE